MGILSDRSFLRAARRQLGHLFPVLPSQDALHKRRARLAETIEWLIGVFAAQSPGAHDDLGTVLRRPRAWWIYRGRDGRLLDPTHVREYGTVEDFEGGGRSRGN